MASLEPRLQGTYGLSHDAMRSLGRAETREELGDKMLKCLPALPH